MWFATLLLLSAVGILRCAKLSAELPLREAPPSMFGRRYMLSVWMYCDGLLLCLSSASCPNTWRFVELLCNRWLFRSSGTDELLMAVTGRS